MSRYRLPIRARPTPNVLIWSFGATVNVNVTWVLAPAASVTVSTIENVPASAGTPCRKLVEPLPLSPTNPV